MNIFVLIIMALMIGSFANVCIYRWPRDLTTLKPMRSFCPWCEHPIAWYDNIPVLSFLFLNQRCRQCQSHISWRYPIVEASMAVLWLATAHFFAMNLFFPVLLVLMFVIVVSTATDLEWKIIPDQVTLPLTILGLLVAPF